MARRFDELYHILETSFQALLQVCGTPTQAVTMIPPRHTARLLSFPTITCFLHFINVITRRKEVRGDMRMMQVFIFHSFKQT
jgi:hypothetical protein